MAIDTAAKRYSMIGFGSPVPRLLPIPDGTIGNADRAMLLYLYHGISLGVLTVAMGRASAIFSAKQPILTFTAKQAAMSFAAKQPSVSFAVTGE